MAMVFNLFGSITPLDFEIKYTVLNESIVLIGYDQDTTSLWLFKILIEMISKFGFFY